VGVGVVAWYGMGEMGAIAKKKDQERIRELSGEGK
jgi:hypothetical protein